MSTRAVAGFSALLLWASAGLAGEGKTLYLHASEVNLRAKPTTRAKVAGKITIGTACELLGKKKRVWVHLRCGDLEGYTLGKFLEESAPRLEPLLDQARDQKRSAKDRLNAAMRAIALDADNAEARSLLRMTYLDVEFALLQEAREDGKGSAPRQMEVDCKSGTIGSCVRKAMDAIAHEWHAWHIRGSDFLSILYFNERLHLVAGGFSEGEKKGKARATITITKSYKASPSLLAVLQKGSHKAESSHIFPLDSESLALLLRFPKTWYPIDGVPEDPHYFVECGTSLHVGSREISIDEKGIFPVAGFSEDRWQDTASYHILSLRRSGFNYTMKVQRAHFGDAKVETIRIEYPQEGMFENISYWKGDGKGRNYGKWIGGQNNTDQNFPIREEKDCPEEDGPP